MATKSSTAPGVEIHRGKVRVWFFYDGERRRESLDLDATPVNLRYAGKLRATIKEEIRHGLFDYGKTFPNSPYTLKHFSGDHTFGHYAEVWLKIAETEVAASTLKKYKSILNTLWLPELKDRPINLITTLQLREILATKQFISEKTHNNYLIPLHQVFNAAGEDDFLDKDASMKLKNKTPNARPPDPLNQDEVELVLAHMKKKYGEQVWNYFEVAFFTGLRPNEQIELKWGDIDWRGGFMRVERGRVNGNLTDTKTHQMRDVEMHPRVVAALKRQQAHTLLAGDLVFLHPATGHHFFNEKPMRENWWKPTLKALKLRDRACYQTRHTFATMAIMAGANPGWISNQMGHGSLQMLFNVYGKWLNRSDNGRELAKFAAATQAVAHDLEGEFGGVSFGSVPEMSPDQEKRG